MLKKDSYDAVLVSIGSDPIIPPIPGADGNNVMFAEQVFGNEIKAKSVVLAVGMEPKTDEALEYYGVGGRTYMIGDCHTVGNVQKAMHSAYSIASTI